MAWLFIPLKTKSRKNRCRRLSNDGKFVTDDRVTRERNRFVFSPEFTSKGQTARNYLSSERNTNAQGALKKRKLQERIMSSIEKSRRRAKLLLLSSRCISLAVFLPNMPSFIYSHEIISVIINNFFISSYSTT